MGVGSEEAGGAMTPWIFIHGTDIVDRGLIVLFFSIFSVLPPEEAVLFFGLFFAIFWSFFRCSPPFPPFSVVSILEKWPKLHWWGDCPFYPPVAAPMLRLWLELHRVGVIGSLMKMKRFGAGTAFR